MSQSTYGQSTQKDALGGDMNNENFEFKQLPGFDAPDPFVATQESILCELDRKPNKTALMRDLAAVAASMPNVRAESMVFDAVIALKAHRLVDYHPASNEVILVAGSPKK